MATNLELECWEEHRGQNIAREDEPRSPWERDFARIVHCPAFRRLQSKTQVLGLGDSDFYRTRLTHSMEVAQVSTAITDYLRGMLRKRGTEICNTKLPLPPHIISRLLPDPHLISAIGLAHDLGHPPYGHGGEVALNYCMQQYGGFEGNGQTLRILTRLEKYVRGYGLNPTRRLLLGILKYPIPYSKASHPLATTPTLELPWLIKSSDYKPPKCYLDTEHDVVKWILAPFSSKDKDKLTNPPLIGEKQIYYHALDTSIMELADDICYSVHDLEDAISLKLVTRENFWPAFRRAGGTTAFLHSIDKKIQSRFDNYEPIKTTLKKLFSPDSCIRKASIGRLIHLCIIHCRLRYNDALTHPLLSLNACLEEPFAQLQKQLGRVIVTLVIKSPNVQHLEFKGQRIVIELFKALEMDPERFLPENTLATYRQATDEESQKRVICDYIAGMTDEYAAKLYERIFCPHKGSVFERL